MEIIELPQGVTAEINGNEVAIRGSLGSNSRKFNDTLLIVTKEGSTIKVDSTQERAIREKALNSVKSFATEIRNDINGVQKHFEVKMEVVFSHFPATVEVKGARIAINKILGERIPRYANIVGTTKVEVKDKAVRIYGTSLDNVTQTAANVRTACKIRKKDIRIFQDGVYYAAVE
jgi:large subunit ribosomal protein L6